MAMASITAFVAPLILLNYLTLAKEAFIYGIHPT